MSKKPQFSPYEGQFKCSECSATISSARFYYSSYDFTWRCDDCSHISIVSLYVKGY